MWVFSIFSALWVIMRLLVLGLPQCLMSHDKPVWSNGASVYLFSHAPGTWNSEFAACHPLPETKPFTAFPAPCYNLLVERSHLEPTIMLGSCTSDSLGFKGWFLVPPLHNMLQLDLKNDLYWQVKESKAREIVQLAKSLKHEGLSLTTRNYVNQAGACWNAPEILVLGRRREEKATTWDVNA